MFSSWRAELVSWRPYSGLLHPHSLPGHPVHLRYLLLRHSPMTSSPMCHSPMCHSPLCQFSSLMCHSQFTSHRPLRRQISPCFRTSTLITCRLILPSGSTLNLGMKASTRTRTRISRMSHLWLLNVLCYIFKLV
ncbi:hypothetical protein LINPERPRIM_LOCUS37919 [Linum perenne]